MKKIIGILLLGLLGFLGCSGSDDGTSAVTGEASPVTPFGIIDILDPSYQWTPVPGATRYRLLVQDANQASTIQDTAENAVIDEWYTAEEAGCATEEGLCMVTPTAEVIGKNEFKVQACANTNCAQWSESLDFDFTALNEPRFTDNDDGTVTDSKTNLMWSKDANLLGGQWGIKYMDAVQMCSEGPVWGLGGYHDWRLPSMPELKSLIDTSQSDPALPPGNPFINVQSYSYWTTLAGPYSYFHHVVYMPNGGAGGWAYDWDELYGWPVRAPVLNHAVSMG
jgi:hypothetical protein